MRPTWSAASWSSTAASSQRSCPLASCWPRFREVLKRHEQREVSLSEELSVEDQPRAHQQSIFKVDPTGVLEELRSLNIDETKPIEAIMLLDQLKSRVRSDAA